MKRKDKVEKIIEEDFEKYKKVFINLAKENNMNTNQKEILAKDLTNAILNGRKGFKISPIVSVELPAPQTAGTYTQQRTYAEQKAWEIINQLKNINE